MVKKKEGILQERNAKMCSANIARRIGSGRKAQRPVSYPLTIPSTVSTADNA
jgi:hypothetical protein